MRGALWWLRQSHSVNYANHQHSPGGGKTFQTPFSPVSFGKFHENPFSRSRERLSRIFLRTEKNHLIGGCLSNDVSMSQPCGTCIVVYFSTRWLKNDLNRNCSYEWNSHVTGTNHTGLILMWMAAVIGVCKNSYSEKDCECGLNVLYLMKTRLTPLNNMLLDPLTQL